MSSVRLGGALAALDTRMEGKQAVRKTPDGDFVTETYNVDLSTVETALAGYTFGDAHASLDCELRTMSYRSEGPRNAIVTLTYEPPGWWGGGGSDPVGTIRYESDANAIEIPIEQHDKWVSTFRAQRVEGGVLEGVQAFLSAQPIFRRIETLVAFTFTETNVVKNVALRFTAAQMAARGLGGATLDKWLKTGLEIRQNSDRNFVKTESWQYAEKGWNTDIYDPAVGS